MTRALVFSNSLTATTAPQALHCTAYIRNWAPFTLSSCSSNVKPPHSGLGQRDIDMWVTSLNESSRQRDCRAHHEPTPPGRAEASVAPPGNLVSHLVSFGPAAACPSQSDRSRRRVKRTDATG